jgi:hypothetical protein
LYDHDHENAEIASKQVAQNPESKGVPQEVGRIGVNEDGREKSPELPSSENRFAAGDEVQRSSPLLPTAHRRQRQREQRQRGDELRGITRRPRKISSNEYPGSHAVSER